MTDQQTDVLIVGAGPVGLVTALMFEKLGINWRIVERRSKLHQAPQAHVISSRALEICRSLGIDDAEIRALGPNPEDTLNIRWVDHLLGRDLGVYSMASDPDSAMRLFAQTPTPICNLSQDKFEKVLFDHLAAPSSVLFNHAWVSAERLGQSYVSQIEQGDGTTTTIRSRFIVGADGAGSGVRRSIGARMEGPHHIQSFVNIHFHANLREQLQGREGLLYWVMDPECAGTFIAHEIDHNWIYMKTLDTDQPPEQLDEPYYAELLRKAIGADVPHDIQSMNSWVMTAQVSDAYQKEGVFLVGDAAHRFPPTGGIGMNTGFQDAHNLTWKIAMVLRGGDAGLLETYELERRPSAAANSKQSHQNFLNMVDVNKALDVDGDGMATMSDFDRVLEDADRQSHVQQAINNQAKHFNMAGLDLGVCYASQVIWADGAPPVSDNPISHYVPSTTPGCRLPHCWLQQGAEKLSTLDLVQRDAFLVLAFDADPNGLDSACEDLANAGYPVRLVQVGPQADVTPAEDQFQDLFATDQVLIVRPDGHIAARLTLSEATQKLQEFFASAINQAA